MMLKTVRNLAGAVAVALMSAFPAVAEGWNVYDLGSAKNQDVCMARAEQAGLAYRRAHGAGDVNVTEWVVYIYFMEPGNQFATIACPVFDGKTQALLHVFGTDSPENRQFTTDELVRLYNF